ncbi:MAG: 4-(cytidine 5'-diphospho)-2-C-methyl-D-erythritol kinase [Desulfomonile tiedjei]|uniref:4-diphosphocytidyl-2-C-methyl-D-erythritol kinase n=1 Tax=Desulfomonile tiedjei TaxID=2358 RepID=A0A9D6Z780_9BACT|nr:4-(cytidine 5'-diphospho)-2-C-methyl-D-erythritol kinase [Desulfomonile tiedjei]
MRIIRALAPAKINLFLRVLARRPYGYHSIETLFQAIDLYDELIVEETSGSTALEVVGIPELQSEGNLVMRALRWLEKHVGVDLRVKIRLDKRIPMAAGLGGGSSDAAAALLSIRELFRLPVSDEEIRSAALGLGADVPFFFTGGAAVGEGIGELVTPVTIPEDYGLLLVNPGFPVSTAAVYSEFSKTLTGRSREGRLWNVLREARTLADLLHNDLQPVTESLYPEVFTIRTRLKEQGLLGVLMSGSGPTVFGIVEHGNAVESGKGLPLKWRAIVARPLNHGVTLE